MGQGALDAAKGSVDLAIGLVGYIALFLGLMKVVEEAGGLAFMARLIRPVLVRLFPDVPPDHPAMGAMVMNIAANALGLGNAATPFGLKAMKELNDLNTQKEPPPMQWFCFWPSIQVGWPCCPRASLGFGH